MSTRTLELTHEEIQTIERALQHLYETRLDIVSANRNVLDKDAIDSILKTANEYGDLRNDIENSTKDV